MKVENERKEYQKKRKRRRLKRRVRRVAVLAVSAALILGLAGLITGLIQGGAGAAASSGQGASAGAAPAGEGEDDSGGSAAGWKFIGPVEQAAPEMRLTTADSSLIALPENGRVDMRYFDSVAFVGDSITQGLEYYSTIPNATYCAYQSIGPRQFYDGSLWENLSGEQQVPMEALVAAAPKNIYVMMGTNTMVNAEDEYLLEAYDGMLDAIMQALPDAKIYVQSIMPVVAGVDTRFDMNRIRALNEALAAMAWEKGLYYLNLHETMTNEDGDLRAEYGGGDGYHMTPAGCRAWLEYLVTHTAYSPGTPYLEGSYYYEQLPVAQPQP